MYGDSLKRTIGKMAGVAAASRDVADECYDDSGKKHDEVVAQYEKATKDFEAQLSSFCK